MGLSRVGALSNQSAAALLVLMVEAHRGREIGYLWVSFAGSLPL